MGKDIEHTIIGERSKIYREVKQTRSRGPYSKEQVMRQALDKTARNYREQLVREGKEPTHREIQKFTQSVAEHRDKKIRG